jgi:hypothetical protein
MAKDDGRDEEWEDDTEGPWGEDRWEAFMRECDLRSARFGEIFETVIDDPDRDRIIAREMGWDGLGEALDERDAELAAGGGPAYDEEGYDPDSNITMPPGSEPCEEEDDDEFGDRECDRIRAYRLAFDNALKVHDALKPYMAKEVNEKDEDYDRRLGQAYIGCNIAAAKIAGGHAMGYERDVLCGNIANCKRGLVGAVEAEQALLELKEEGLLPAGLVDRLLPDVRAVIDAVKARIEELRAKVWW